MFILRNYIRDILLETSEISRFHPTIQRGIKTMLSKGLAFEDVPYSEGVEIYIQEGEKYVGRFIATTAVDQERYRGPTLYQIVDTNLEEDLRGTGIGPLFYEIIADKAWPAYIINDRGVTSPKAARMWRYFFNHPDEYEQLQLDITYDDWMDGTVLTHTEDDDISMNSFFDLEYENPDLPMNFANYPDIKQKLLASPFSKAYRRKTKSGISDWALKNLTAKS